MVCIHVVYSFIVCIHLYVGMLYILIRCIFCVVGSPRGLQCYGLYSYCVFIYCMYVCMISCVYFCVFMVFISSFSRVAALRAIQKAFKALVYAHILFFFYCMYVCVISCVYFGIYFGVCMVFINCLFRGVGNPRGLQCYGL